MSMTLLTLPQRISQTILSTTKPKLYVLTLMFREEVSRWQWIDIFAQVTLCKASGRLVDLTIPKGGFRL